MNNIRGNNRRRGRGNNRQGGGQQLNRVDSRARGNAPQLLEKYRKLAHDAHLNGDRIQEEYYLQFADHYFRVLADTRQRQDEQRAQRQERWQDSGDGNWRDEGAETAAPDFIADADYPAGEQMQAEPYRERDDRQSRPSRRDEQARATDNAESGEERGSFEPASGNPFLRGGRSARGMKPRREGSRQERDTNDGQLALDPALLPPAIAASRDDASEAAEEAPAPRPRGRPRRKPAVGDSTEAAEAAG